MRVYNIDGKKIECRICEFLFGKCDRCAGKTDFLLRGPDGRELCMACSKETKQKTVGSTTWFPDKPKKGKK